jgi:hypothetical protein
MKRIKVFDLDIEQVLIYENGRLWLPLKEAEGFDPDPRHCSGQGQNTCMAQGRHSWFNHSQDSYYKNPHLSNMPVGFRGLS